MQETINYVDGDNRHIIEVIHKNFPKAINQTKDLAKYFKQSNRKESARKIYYFLKGSCKYEKDPQGQQLIKLPARLVKDRKGDCKSYSLFAAATLVNMGYPVKLRYASYDSSPVPSHVYVITKDTDGKDIILDAVYSKFNSEVPYIHKNDIPMEIKTLSGYDYEDETIDGFFKKVWGGIKKVATGVVKVGKKISAAPIRNAFLLLARLNVRSLATNMAAGDHAKMNKIWQRFGGNTNALWKAVNTGKTKKRLGNTDEAEDKLAYVFEMAMQDWERNASGVDTSYLDEIKDEQAKDIYGVGIGEPLTGAAVIAAVAAATPIVLAMTGAFSKAKDQKIEEAKRDTAALNATGGAMFNTITGRTPYSVANDIIRQPNDHGAVPQFYPGRRPTTDTGTGFKISPMMIGIAAVGLILLTRKK